MARADISKADKAEVLMRLWNYGINMGKDVPFGLTLLQTQQAMMSFEEAEQIVRSGDLDFDYVKGRSMKVDMTKPIVDFWLYDRDCGEGSAKRALEGVAGVEFLAD
jgi:hypothetical protein